MAKLPSLLRRRMLMTAGALPVLCLLGGGSAQAASAEVTGRLARYMAAARQQALPDNVVLACKHRIIDTFGAMVSGARLKAGDMAIRYVRSQGGTAQASVIASTLRTTSTNAALANAMFAQPTSRTISSPRPRPIRGARPCRLRSRWQKRTERPGWSSSAP